MDEAGLLDILLPPQHDDHSGLDVELFLHCLNYREQVVLLLRFWEISNEEIGEVLGVHPSGIYPVLRGIRKKALEAL